jgi:hypothetical protein
VQQLIQLQLEEAVVKIHHQQQNQILEAQVFFQLLHQREVEEHLI